MPSAVLAVDELPRQAVDRLGCKKSSTLTNSTVCTLPTFTCKTAPELDHFIALGFSCPQAAFLNNDISFTSSTHSVPAWPILAAQCEVFVEYSSHGQPSGDEDDNALGGSYILHLKPWGASYRIRSSAKAEVISVIGSK